MGRFFGTDGIRGRAGQPPLDDATVQKIGRAIVRALGVRSPRVLLGRDTRESGARLEAHLAAGLAAQRDLTRAYLSHLSACYRGRSLEGRRLVVDCANGATSFLARRLFEGLGADVTVIHDAPDGRNINHGCGATVPREVADAVVRQGAEMGMAFDGDGDRCILADAAGRVVDGDHVLFLAARDLKARDALKGGAVVATSMSNVGLEVALG